MFVTYQVWSGLQEYWLIHEKNDWNTDGGGGGGGAVGDTRTAACSLFSVHYLLGFPFGWA